VSSEFISIPNPQEGDYRILTQGTGSGEYKVEATRIIENKNSSQDDSESTAVFQGKTTLGNKNDFVVSVSKDDVKEKGSETTLLDNKKPENLKLTISSGKKYF